MNRAYSTFEIKSIDDEQRVVEGIASTPELDRGGDEMDSKGAKYSLPMPFKWQHKEAVGNVIFARVTDAGIHIRAVLPKISEPGLLKERVDYAWQSIKFGLTRGLSIGWTPIKAARNAAGGLKVSEWEWMETSAVDIPMNASSTITLIKQLDTDSSDTATATLSPAASGTGQGLALKTTLGASSTVRVVSATRQDARMAKTIAEQIKDFQITKNDKVERRKALMATASETGLTLDAAQGEEYDTLDAEIKAIDVHLKRLETMEAENKAAAKPAQGANPQDASASRGYAPISVKVNRDPGIGFARIVMAKMASYVSMKEGGFISSYDIARRNWPSDSELHAHLHQKTNIPAATTTETTWATELVEPTTLGNEFLEFLRADTIIGKFGMNGIPALRSLPFNIRIARMTSGLTGYWVGEGLGKPTSKGAIDAVTMPYTKVAAISVITQELARFSSPSAERVVRDELAKSVTARIDTDFVDPAITATSARPASITNGVTALSSAGTSADNARTDVANLVESFILNHMDVASLVLLMPNTLALSLSLLRNSLGQQSFPGLTLKGGNLEGIPVITSQYLASGASYGNMVIALSANDIGLADDGAVDVKVSGEASLEMTDTPTGDSGTPTASQTAVVSMFQTNSLAILAERFITWKKLRSTAVVYMDDVNWGAIGSPF